MRQYDFTLKFALEQHDADPDAFVGMLLQEGCDDALIGIGKRGRIALDFSREANSADDAIISAIAAVKRAIPGARFIEATPDLVGVTDIAELLGFTRQNMRKILESSGPECPPPIHDGKRPIWHLEPILTWLKRSQARQIDQALLEISRINMYCNYARDNFHIDRAIPEPLKEPLKRAVG